ncbi:phosphate acyltransferase PlsX [Alkaliphilus hydrothermalis]|uniref:Phosphate acyltransferase n=1 Tax=Alkaliphilus hydrothermalis TaxID=1482730 RepID=A0ABS2NKZ9_9FIRM|nr:phosphate acyltransferase PlsX [Alkaliphilus hydrothermalis]MBM7613620.1 glycerol-3-phosphate acyltransferase PlsX [Alkaliphilus hydrothermalis]
MKIVLDAMGGDHGPKVTVQGAVDAVNEYGVHMILTGDEEILKKELNNRTYPKDKIEIIHCTEVIENEDKPVAAIKKKKDSSMVVAFKLVKEGKADAMISAGNTGALLAGGLLLLGRIKGIDRPALAPVIPTEKGVSVLIDGGANADCKPRNFLEFGLMGSIYAKKLLNIQRPRVCLVNIGIEEGKGNVSTKEAYEVCKDAPFNFCGNVEARDIPAGYTDVVVCDGFTGNVILKLMEGVAGTFLKILKEELTKNPIRKFGALLMKSGFKGFKKRFDYREYGGAPFLGVKGLLIKAHGSSNELAIKNGIRQAKLLIEKEVVKEITSEINTLGADRLD